jgi:hypothetical protein
MCRSDHGKGFALFESCQWAFKNLAKDTAGDGSIQMREEKSPPPKLTYKDPSPPLRAHAPYPKEKNRPSCTQKYRWGPIASPPHGQEYT